MNINDLRVKINQILERKIILQKRMERNLVILNDLKGLERLKKFQRDQINFSLEMIIKTMNFFAQSKEHENIHVNYIQNGFKAFLKRVKEASFEAIEANTSFEEQATRDPRELIPYARVSDIGPVKKGDRIILSSKMNPE